MNQTTTHQLDNNAENHRVSILPRVVTGVLWIVFLSNLTYLTLNFNSVPQWQYENLFLINGFTILMWTSVSFFGAIVSSFAKNYLTGFKYHSRFMLLSLSFTFFVMLLVMSNHILLLLFSWVMMGIIMSLLIGVDKDWGEAREASKFTRKYFISGSFFLAVGLAILAFSSGEYTVTGLTQVMADLPFYVTLPASLCVIAAAVVQSAIYPFHRWLLSAMTAPTPASALMHAGFVNGAGILLAIFSTLLFASNTLIILFVIGGLTAIIAQFTKLLQVHVKQKLACSTIAQMGFMIMQCGLGFFNAAVVHLILHGFYKAYLFLSAGEEIAQTKPLANHKINIKPLEAIIVFIFSVLGAGLFAYWTGKGMQLNSSLFLTLIVAITVGQATYNIVKEHSLSFLRKFIVSTTIFVLGIGIYALMYNGVTVLMSDMPMIGQPTPLSWPQIIFGVIFLVGFFVMKLGVYKKLPWLYVKLLNVSQPSKKTVLMYKLK